MMFFLRETLELVEAKAPPFAPCRALRYYEDLSRTFPPESCNPVFS
jgi:hypothetical protein